MRDAASFAVTQRPSSSAVAAETSESEARVRTSARTPVGGVAELLNSGSRSRARVLHQRRVPRCTSLFHACPLSYGTRRTDELCVAPRSS